MSRKIGRPSKYSEKVGKLICRRISDGESLKSICKDGDLPNRATVFDWLRLFPAFHDRYRLSRENQVLGLADELLDIVRDPDKDTQSAKLEADVIRWLLSKFLPFSFGDKVQAPAPKAITDQHKPAEDQSNGIDMSDSIAAWSAASKGQPVPVTRRKDEEEAPPKIPLNRPKEAAKEETIADVLDRFRGKAPRRDDD
jgi:hypothetical protein